MKKYKKILVLGSGALKIGEAGEFDYSGSQAIKAFKEEGIRVILINPNIATIQTSENFADEIYFLPITDYFVEKVIKKERPEAVAVSFGGQTALNCGISLYKKGVFKKYKITVLGTPIESVILTEDRQKFANHLKKINVRTPESKATAFIEEAKKIAKELNYPLMIRAAYALGGQKSGVVQNESELVKKASAALSFSPQILIEKYLHHYKEVEYEVVRDQYDNCITVCNMENMDPLGIHTGESIVVAPSQTLTNFEYHHLREVSIKIVRSLKIVGECNVQFALNPSPKKGEIEFEVIEVNARLSRSSALASKATGYPLAYVAAKLVLGKKLMDIQNQVTKVTQSFFEPALDYIVVKMPRWDLEKFQGVEFTIGSSMKSVGEVMGIGRTFEEALQKAIRMLSLGVEGITDNSFPKSKKQFMKFITVPTPKRIFALAEVLKRGMSVKKLYDITGIDPWFLSRIKNIVDTEEVVQKKQSVDSKQLLLLKQIGFSDKRIGRLINKAESEVRALRKKHRVLPSIFQIDTLAGEVPAKTSYLYVTYNGQHNDVTPIGSKGVMVIGSGPYHIGSSVEFDWTCVNTAHSLKKYQKRSIIINCNPETVSTDYDISDRLYFEELTFERIADIYDFEQSLGLILSVGGQTPNNLSQQLALYNVPILGTQAEDIDRAEDRSKFSNLLDTLSIPQPDWRRFITLKEILKFAKKVGYPLLVRPSYVLSGSAMNVCYTKEELKTYITKATEIGKDFPITISKFITDAKELEFDGIAQKGEIHLSAISEHIEQAGVHSGDASIVYPPHKIYLRTEQKIIDISCKIAAALRITGPFNIQFIAKENDVFVIEVNLRASRTLPFISKVTKHNFASALGDALFFKSQKKELSYPNYFAVKVPQFSFSRLEGANPGLRVEMSSTGEVACFGTSVEEAFLKAELSVGAKIPTKGFFLSLGGDQNKVKFLDSIIAIVQFGLPIYATEKTALFLKANGIKAKRLYKIHENKKPDLLSYIQEGRIDLAINIVDPFVKKELDDDYIIRRTVIDHNVFLLTDRQNASLFIKALIDSPLSKLDVLPWSSYK
jgi:carbamoyl-phosphate synthase large subunit